MHLALLKKEHVSALTAQPITSSMAIAYLLLLALMACGIQKLTNASALKMKPFHGITMSMTSALLLQLVTTETLLKTTVSAELMDLTHYSMERTV
jgi:hypothetical protein